MSEKCDFRNALQKFNTVFVIIQTLKRTVFEDIKNKKKRIKV